MREDEELPVVSRIVIEVRSDGTRTIARGAAEDPSGKVGLEVRADTPVELARALVKLLLQVPALATTSFRAGRKRQVDALAADGSPPPRALQAPRGLAARVRRRLGLSD